jgi:hypothetical protein
MTIFTPIPTLLAVILTTGYILSVLADVPLCYYPDGSTAQSDFACNLTAEHSFCCAVGYNCLENKICVAVGESTWNRGSCTDKSWNSPECPRFCMDFRQNGGSFIVNCAEDAGVCCYDTLVFPEENRVDCCSANLTEQNPVTMLPGEPTPFTLISKGASTQTKIMSSSSSSSSSSTSTTSATSTGSSTTATTTTPTSSTSNASPTAAASSSSSSLTTGAYVGIAIGIAAAVGIFFFRKRQRSKRQQSQSPMTPLVSPPWNNNNNNNNNNSPDFPHGDKEQGNAYEYRTSEVAQLHELTAESERSELRGETLLELEGSDGRR